LECNMRRIGQFLVVAAIAGTLAACESVSALGPGATVAELDTADNPAAAVNISSLTEAVNRRPNDPEAFNQRGAAYARIGRFSDAIADFSKAVSLEPGFAPAYTNRGLAQRQTGRNDAALQDFSRAIQANPSYAPAYLAAISCAARTSCPRRSATSIKQSGSTLKGRRRCMHGALSISARTITGRLCRISTRPLTATRTMPRPIPHAARA
jgi:tetratricopeptide (TPR) repeat protein